MTESKIGFNELESILDGINGLTKEDLGQLSSLAAGWRAQADLEQMTRERFDTLVHGKTVEANAIMPTLELRANDEEEFKRRKHAYALKIAEQKILQWAFSEFKTIDVESGNKTDLLES